MDIGIGPTLREARTRRRVDLEAVEAETKIRVRYLRAMENEDWDALPGGAYTRGFIRTYAGYLGLDGERLADEYRRATGAGASERAPRVEPAATGASPRRRSRLSTRVWAVLVSAVLVGVLIAIGLSGGGDDASTNGPQEQGQGRGNGGGSQKASDRPEPVERSGVAVELTATAEVWVCLLDGQGRPLIEGEVLAEGASEGPFRSGGFTVAFGNGEVEMLVDGAPAAVPDTSSPIGYEIRPGGQLTELPEGERPTCT